MNDLNDPNDPADAAKEARKWAAICHLSALAGLLGNGVGFLLGPLIVWVVKKQDDPFIDENGKEAVNFQITMFLALIVSAVLIFVVVGFFLLILVGIVMVVLPVIAGIKASDGELFRYPLTIRFIR